MGGRKGSEGCRLTRMTHVQGRARSESPLARAQIVSVLIGDAKEAEGIVLSSAARALDSG